jgi:hypothetical protein
MERTRTGRGRLWPFAFIVLFWASGCAMFQDSGSNLRNYAGVPAQANQPVKLTGGFGGVSAESQQIERSLGIK